MAATGAAGHTSAIVVFNESDDVGVRFAAEVYRVRRRLQNERTCPAPLRDAQEAFAAAMALARDGRHIESATLLERAEQLWREWAKAFPERGKGTFVLTDAEKESSAAAKSLERLSLPPLYPSKQVREMLSIVLKGIYRSNAGRTGNVILGKTTLLKAAFIMHVLAFPDDVCAFWDYELSMAQAFSGDADRVHEVMPTPNGVISDVMSWLERDELAAALKLAPDDALAIEQVRDRTEHQIAMYVDEVNELYIKRDDLWRARGKVVVRALNYVGKQNRCWVLATASGSSTSLLERVFPAKDGPWEGYHTFNRSVFKAHAVLPIRVVDELRNYVQARYDKDIPESRAAHLLVCTLACTGGIGRHVHDIIDDEEWVAHGVRKLPERLQTARFRRFAALLWMYTEAARSAREAKRRDDAARGETKTGTVVGDVDVLNPDELGVHIPAVPDSMIASAEVAGFSGDDLKEWASESIVMHSDAESRWELVIPLSYDTVIRTLHADATARQALALLVTMRGWGGDGSAGAVLEPLVLSGVGRGDVKEQRLKVGKDGPLWTTGHAKRPGHREDPVEDPSQVLSRMVQLTKDNGLDGFYIERSSKTTGLLRKKTQPVWLIHGYQVKMGEAGKTLGPGVIKTQRKYPNNSTMDETVAGIIAKAERGFWVLCDMLAKRLPDRKFQVSSLTLLTNKTLTRAAETRITEISLTPQTMEAKKTAGAKREGEGESKEKETVEYEHLTKLPKHICKSKIRMAVTAGDACMELIPRHVRDAYSSPT